MDRKQLCAAVTGGAKGIGEAIVRRLMQDGYGHVVLLDVDVETASEAAKRIDPKGETVLPYACDVSDAQAVEECFAQIARDCGPVLVLVNNAGITKDGMFHKMTRQQWDQVIDVNLSGMYNTCRAVIGPMRERAYGKIVNLASVSAFGNVGQTNYGASKAGVIVFTKCLAEMLRAVPEETMRRFIEAIPAQRLARPEEIASVVSFLCSDDSSFVNGECIIASGGSYM